MRHSLFTKIVLLLAVPLTLQLAFSLYLMKVYSEISGALSYQRAAMDAVKKMAVLSEMLVATGQNLAEDAIARPGGNQESLTAFGATNLDTAFSELKDAGKPYPDLMAITRAIVDDTTSYILETTEAVLEKRRDAQSVERFAKFRNSYIEKNRLLMDRPAGHVVERYLRATEVRSAILFAMIGIVIVNVVVALLLWLIMRRNIVLYVDRMDKNFKRLHANQPLPKPLSGTDEIAAFDRAFHSVVAEVMVARLERQEYLAMISSKMKEPLVSLEEFLKDTRETDSGDLSDKGKNALTTSSKNIKRLVSMLNELIDFEQIERGGLSLRMTKTTSKDIISNAIDCVEHRATESGIKIIAGERILSVNADADRLTQVLINLLTNAIKFSPRNSSIQVRARKNGSNIMFVVEDEGRGIPDEKMDSIFQRFEQVDQSDAIGQKGSGLGLAICKTIVEAHGGEIWAENNEGAGARFTFEIPQE